MDNPIIFQLIGAYSYQSVPLRADSKVKCKTLETAMNES